MKKYILILVALWSCGFAFAQISFDLAQFSDSTKYGWADLHDRIVYRYDLTARQKLLQIYEMESQTLTSTVIKSAIVPGWGQFSTEHYTRGQAILGAELVLLGASLYFYDRSMDYYRKYEDATQIEEIDNMYKKAQQPYQYSMIFLGMASVVWAYNIFDVIQATEAYNANLWNKIFNEYYQPLQITPTGIQLRF